ncbi:MAG: M48 family metalloprotease [Candidatus Aenigmarchaeota archaeon]|nr:M48 family metalloprotease [Candidatus Aenigmarchaeota archaeon]
MRLFLASVFTILLLSGFLATALFVLLFFAGFIDAAVLISLVILFNFVLWLVSPKLSDFIYRYFFKMRWMSLEELGKRSRKTVEFLENTCRKYNFPLPKLGIIDDKNPNAFTYGSGRWNARIIVTEGIFHYLEEDHIVAVYAHELGHIKNRDFIIMTLASTILQLLYVVSQILIRSRLYESSGRGGSKREGGGIILIVGIISYIFYLIGQYIVLYLSRVREYYADEFSARETGNPNALSLALIRIAYGILANPDNVELINTTKHMGIVNFHAAKSTGLTYHISQKLRDASILERAFLFDICNPWAFISELNSTHPLTGKRIRRLCMLCKDIGVKSLFDFDKIREEYQVDRRKLRWNFVKDMFVLFLPVLLATGFPVIYILLHIGMNSDILSSLFVPGFVVRLAFELIPFWLIIIGLTIVVRTLYRYPRGRGKEMRIVDLLCDVYASPVRGRKVVVNGKFIGKGVPGFIFSEDMMMKDSTGLIYLNYESWLPFLGNLIFSVSKVNELIGKEARVEGWFLRGLSSRIDLDYLKSGGEIVKSYVKLLGILSGLIIAGIGLMLIFGL